MGKTRVHLLAKELGIETKDLIAQLDKLGMRGRKAQSALEDEEVTRIRAALAAQEKPQVHVGEEKVVADRVVVAEDESAGEVQARETVVERRVRANVIRRRTSRTEVAQPEAAPAQVVESPVEAPAPAHAMEEVELPPPPEEASAVFDAGIEFLVEEPAHRVEEPAPVEAKVAEVLREKPVAEPRPQPSSPEIPPVSEKPVEAPTEAPRGARILGRIDLRRTMQPAPISPMPGRRPAAVTPGAPAVAGPRPLKPSEGEIAKPEGGEAEKPAKAGRHKKRVVKKQEVLE